MIHILKKYFGETLIVVGILLLGLSVTHTMVQAAFEKKVVQHIELEEVMVSETVSFPTHVKIGEKVDVAIQEGFYINGQWTIERDTAMHWKDSAVPRTAGNIVIYGHNTISVFGRLHLVEVGEKVEITNDKGEVSMYTITEKIVVEPEKIDYILPTNSETLTIYTCIGWMDSKRLIIQSEPVKD